MPLHLPRSLVGLSLLFAGAPAFCTELASSETSTVAASSAVVAVDLAPLDARTEALLECRELTAYRGWLKYLRYVAHDSATRKGGASEPAKAAASRLDEWLTKIAADPGLLSTLRGVQEWAYESAVDGSGQPFKIVIPDDYRADKPAALSLYLHGATGNHLDHSGGFHAHGGNFDLAVLGRSRVGGYNNLSEADVLAVLDYVQQHWSIDPARLWLSGGSMGGMGTYRLGSRYPHLWASGAVTCGAGEFVSAGNLRTLPLYMLHSIDDPVVPVLQSRSVVQRLQDIGGQIIRDETNGLGHASWDYKVGQERAATWSQAQVKPESRTIRHIDYTAVDGVATRGWWAEVTEWGDAPTFARIVATAGTDNTLFATFTNLKAATFRLAESPFDATKDLKISIDAGVLFTVAAPLPGEITVAREGEHWVASSTRPSASTRLHTPGGPSLLYNGEPLLIVYGTQGDEAHNAALLAAARCAAQSPGPIWQEAPSAGNGRDADGISQTENLYGPLAIKADRDVTTADLAHNHLVLIGNVSENSLVARLAPQLPVSLTADAVVCSDGERVSGEHLALGLVHFNPLAPQRLLFWVAGSDLEAYAPGAIIPQTMAGRGNTFFGVHFGADLLVNRTGAHAQDVVATRSFNSRWEWTGKRDASPLVTEEFRTYRGFYQKLAEAVRRHAQADFGLAAYTDRPAPQPLQEVAPRTADFSSPGTTRLADVQALFPFNAIGVFEISGADLAAALAKTAEKSETFAIAGPAIGSLDPARTYTVALPTESIWTWNSLTKFVPAHYRQTELTVAGALSRY